MVTLRVTTQTQVNCLLVALTGPFLMGVGASCTPCTGILRHLTFQSPSSIPSFPQGRRKTFSPQSKTFSFPPQDGRCMNTHSLHGNAALISKTPRSLTMWVLKYCPKSGLFYLNSCVGHQWPNPSSAASSLSISISQTSLPWPWGKKKSRPAWPSFCGPQIFMDTFWKKIHWTGLPWWQSG